MRKVKRKSPAAPFVAGFIIEAALTLILSAIGAVILFLLDAVESGGTVSVMAGAAACFFGSAAAGRLKGRHGLQTGFICGVMYIVPCVVVSLLWGAFTGGLFLLRTALYLSCSITGAVLGVNKA